jgi:hypothetical protein
MGAGYIRPLFLLKDGIIFIMDNLKMYQEAATLEHKEFKKKNCLLCFNLRFRGNFNALICEDAPEEVRPFEIWHRITPYAFLKMSALAGDCSNYDTEEEEKINAIVTED